MAQQSESFGPFSEPIDVQSFIKDTTYFSGTHVLPHWNTWCSLPDAAQKAIEHECNVEEFATEAEDAIDNQAVQSHFNLERARTISSLYREKETDYKRKRKKRFGEESHSRQPVHPDIEALVSQCSNLPLKCCQLTPAAGLFIRKAKAYEHNALLQIKSRVASDPPAEMASTSTSMSSGQALITITVYDRAVAHPHYVHRSSTHVMLSSQSLGDLYDAIPCPSKEYPREILNDNDEVVGYDETQHQLAGAVVCIGGTAYGETTEHEDYSDKLISYIDTLNKSSTRAAVKLYKGCNMHAARFDSLRLALHFPNWILHHGNCEHYFAVDQIRMQHPTDPQTGYPLTLHISPPTRGICRVCERIPSAFALVNDLRLPDTPFLICQRCLEQIGEPTNAEALLVPLIRYSSW